jgi:predicted TIM-barrel fold metal-dependent hydrolase
MIDIHTHPVMVKELFDSDYELGKRINEIYGFCFPPQPLNLFFREMDEAGIDQAILLPIDVTSSHGGCIITNRQISWLVEKNPRLVGFASVDPGNKSSPEQLIEDVTKFGLRGLKLDPSLQCFYPNDKLIAYPIYEACRELAIPVLLHMGMSWSPIGLANYSNPINMEEVFIKFGDINFILAHFAWPWVDEAVMLAIKYPNVYIDTSILYSGTPSEAISRIFENQIGMNVIKQSLSKKIVFGSNYPRVDMRRSAKAIQNLQLDWEVYENITQNNARRLLGI